MITNAKRQTSREQQNAVRKFQSTVPHIQKCIGSCRWKSRLGVHLHGLAAHRWAETHGTAGMLAGDLLPLMPAILSEMRYICE